VLAFIKWITSIRNRESELSKREDATVLNCVAPGANAVVVLHKMLFYAPPPQSERAILLRHHALESDFQGSRRGAPSPRHTWDQSRDLAWLTAKNYIKSVKSGWIVTSIRSVWNLYLIWQTDVISPRTGAVLIVTRVIYQMIIKRDGDIPSFRRVHVDNRIF
jgi:hypothetical protein